MLKSISFLKEFDSWNTKTVTIKHANWEAKPPGDEVQCGDCHLLAQFDSLSWRLSFQEKKDYSVELILNKSSNTSAGNILKAFIILSFNKTINSHTFSSLQKQLENPLPYK